MRTAYVTRCVALALLLLHPAGPLEAVEEPRDAGGAEDDRPGEVDPAEPVLRGVVELDEDVVVAAASARARPRGAPTSSRVTAAWARRNRIQAVEVWLDR